MVQQVREALAVRVVMEVVVLIPLLALVAVGLAQL